MAHCVTSPKIAVDEFSQCCGSAAANQPRRFRRCGWQQVLVPIASYPCGAIAHSRLAGTAGRLAICRAGANELMKGGCHFVRRLRSWSCSCATLGAFVLRSRSTVPLRGVIWLGSQTVTGTMPATSRL
ncbi:hypothetical protein CPT34_31865 [Rhizobium sophoriradicis]|uniref:Uncharacterized protein n=1 Tax=Rhizobium sophoriradicis TaxID=1535245 RepID=A0A2A5KJB0_9HYPH|nr:hypothetical protein CPT34_31865 [Rhizobium sophoriradicis]PDS94168.1 hypothetical protein CO659_30390 [Rhizobium sp. S9]PDT06876.1 hypothetical protein CO655_30220 [Rhizobium sp. M1]PDT30378.1 hypothetical protein CO671_31985 [Rhizobium sp. M10]